MIDLIKADYLKTGVAPATVDRKLELLRAAFNLAMKRGLCSSSPMIGVRLIRANNERLKYFIDGQHSELLAAAAQGPQYLLPLVQLALHTGARKSNLMHLRWEQIDSNARTVRFTKTKNNRTVMIPLDDTVLSVLKTLREQTADSEWVFPELQSGRSFRTAWRTCLKRAGITGWRWHDLRHAFASSLSQNGVDINSVRQLLGHADLRSTVRYAALSPDFLAAQIRVLDKALPKNCQSPAPKRRKSRQTAATRKSLRKAATA